MTNQEALDTLYKGLDVATQKGNFNLNEVMTLGNALQVLRAYIVTHQPDLQNMQRLRDLSKDLEKAPRKGVTEDTV